MSLIRDRIYQLEKEVNRALREGDFATAKQTTHWLEGIAIAVKQPAVEFDPESAKLAEKIAAYLSENIDDAEAQEVSP